MSGGSVYCAAAQQALEEPRRLEDIQPDLGDLAVLGHDLQAALALDPGERGHLNAVCHGPSVMARCLLAERLSAGGERAERADQVALARAELVPARGKRRGVRRLHRPEAAVAAPGERRAQRAAAGLRHRAEAGRPVRHHHAGVPGALALDAHAVPADPRLAAEQVRRDHLEQLAAVDGAAAQLEVDRARGRRSPWTCAASRCRRAWRTPAARGQRRSCAAPGCRRRWRTRRW